MRPEYLTEGVLNTRFCLICLEASPISSYNCRHRRRAFTRPETRVPTSGQGRYVHAELDTDRRSALALLLQYSPIDSLSLGDDC